MRAAIYKRVSTDEQVDGYSLDRQEDDCRLHATRQGWRIVDVYTDEGISGRKEDRPALQRLLADVRARRIDVVLVYKIDRLARNTRLQLQLAEEFERQRVQLVSVTEPMEYRSSSGRFSLSVLAGAAQFFSDALGERVAGALERKARTGGWVGPVPLGYVKNETGQLVPSEDAPAIVLCFRLYASGTASYTDVADALNAAGWRTLDWRTKERRSFGRESVRTILKNRAYIGMVSSGGVEYQGAHAPLVSGELWSAANGIRAERTAWHGAPIKTSDAWLTGRIFCDHCGRKVWHHTGGRDNSIRYYRCSGHSNRVCAATLIPAPLVEADVLEVVGQLTIPPALVDAVVADTERQLQALQQPAPDVVDRVAVEAKLKRLARLYEDGLKSDEAYARERDQLRLQLAAAETAAVLRVDAGTVARQLADLPALLIQATAAERRAVIRSVFERVWVRDRVLSGLTARPEVYPLLQAVSRVVYGVADGTSFPHPQPTRPPVILHIPQRERITLPR